MNWLSNAELVAAVSGAGGLGTIHPMAALKPHEDSTENLRQHIIRARELTDRPFAVNIPLDRPTSGDWVAVTIAERVPIAITSAGSPATYTAMLKEAGIKVLHVVASVRHARGAEAQGVDAVIAEGYEAGGHNGPDELPTFVLVPQVVDAVKIPVVAAGGIADARGVVAAFALGAEGVQLGTIFMATHECVVHPRVKEALVQADDTATVISFRKLGSPARGLNTPATLRYIEMEDAGASVEELRAAGRGSQRRAALEGDLVEGALSCGQIVGMVKEVIGAGEMVRRIVNDVPGVLARLE
jgi:enoyl-[acyl-carrier protein] reductase II